MGLPENPGAATADSLQNAYPNYLATAHIGFLMGGDGITGTTLEASNPGTDPYNAQAFTVQAVDENPYVTAETHDPADEISYSEEAINDFETLLAEYLSSNPNTAGEQATMEDFISKASALFSSYGFDFTDDVDEAVTDFEASSEDDFLRRRSAFSASMFNINALETTPYRIGLALIDNERVRTLDTLRSRLLSQGRRDKNVFLVQLADLMTSIQGRNIGLSQALSSMKGEQARFSYASNREKVMQNIEYDVGEVSWELESLKSGASILSAIQGIPMSPTKPSNLATAVSAALSIGPQVGLGIGQATRSPALGIAGGVIASLFAYGSNING